LTSFLGPAVPTVTGLAREWPAGLDGLLSAILADSLGSTQTLARHILDRHFEEDESPHPFAVVALAQRAGRGRRGRPWSSAYGLGVWATLASPARGGPELQSYPMRACLALAELVNGWTGGACRIKWPNDLVVGHRKLGGVLVDGIVRPDGTGWALIGFGLNHGHSQGQLPETGATSLALLRPIGLPKLERAAGLSVAAVFEALRSPDSWLDRYRALSAHSPGDPIECEVGGERLAGRFAGFDERGFLRLATDRGTRTLTSAEIFAW
jgi:BirA family biotin operon repressor/biotin-[acetyl-CoA-carboxylase] ligase